MNCNQSSFQDYSSQSKYQYDQIICNPPFFSASTKAPSKEKNLARHDDSLSLRDIFKGSVSLKKETTIISLILPVDKEAQAFDLILEHQMYCKRRTQVIPAPGKSTNRILLEFSLVSEKCQEDEITIETGERHSYSDKYKSLTDSFYL